MLGILPRRVLLCAALATSLVGTALAAAPVPPTPPWVDPRHAGLPPWLRDDAPSRTARPLQSLAPLQAPTSAAPDSLDANWQSGFGLPVPDSYIYSLLVSGGVLVAGGGFERIGDMDAPGLAAWDGTTWSLIGEFPGIYVRELAPYPDGFVVTGSSSGATVWHWNGATWETWSGPGDLYTTALAVDGTSVAIATVTNTGTAEPSHVLLHTPSGWTQLGGTFDEQVLALAWYGGSLYAAGMFDHVDGILAPRIARWDGARWLPLAQQLTHNKYDWVRSLAVYRGELVAAGSFGYRLDPSQPRFFARWDGSRWAPLGVGGPDNPNLIRLRVVGEDLYAVGNYAFGAANGHGISRWDGTAWHLDEENLQVFVDDVALFLGDLHAGGALSRNGLDAASPLMRRQAGVWRTPVPGPGMRGLLGWSGPDVQALALTDRGIVAAGRFDFAGEPGGWRETEGIALWNGTEWSPLGLERQRLMPEPSDLVIHQGALYAIGSFDAGSVLKFTNPGWAPLGGPLNLYRGLSAFGDLYVAGAVMPGDGFGGLARWNGTSWVSVGGGVTRGDYITSMVELGSELVIGGEFHEVGGVACENIAAWNPARGWHPLGAGVEGTVSDLTVRDGVLYASGSCGLGISEPETYSGIVRWNHGRWESVEPRIGGVDRLGWYRGQLVASWYGGLQTLGADGTWHRLGSGTNGVVLDMVERGSSLFVGGFFSRAGSTSAFGFAEWRDDSPIPTPAPKVAPLIAPAITSTPNPFVASVHLRYELPVATRARVEVFDLTGHRVDLVFDGQQNAGMQDVVWQPNAARVRAGVYFARLTVGVSNRVVQVLRIP